MRRIQRLPRCERRCWKCHPHKGECQFEDELPLGSFPYKPLVARDAQITSVWAAESILRYVTEQEWLVVNFLGQRHSRGATDNEGQAAVKLAGNSYRPRRRALVTAGFVINSGRKRLNKRGRKCIVWMLTENAQVAWKNGDIQIGESDAD